MENIKLLDEIVYIVQAFFQMSNPDTSSDEKAIGSSIMWRILALKSSIHESHSYVNILEMFSMKFLVVKQMFP